MTKKAHIRPADIRGYNRLAVDAEIGLSNLVEPMHETIARAPGVLDTSPRGPAKGIAGLVYKGIRGTARLVGGGSDVILERLIPLLDQGLSPMARRWRPAPASRRSTCITTVDTMAGFAFVTGPSGPAWGE